MRRANSQYVCMYVCMYVCLLSVYVWLGKIVLQRTRSDSLWKRSVFDVLNYFFEIWEGGASGGPRKRHVRMFAKYVCLSCMYVCLPSLYVCLPSWYVCVYASVRMSEKNNAPEDEVRFLGKTFSIWCLIRFFEICEGGYFWRPRHTY